LRTGGGMGIAGLGMPLGLAGNGGHKSWGEVTIYRSPLVLRTGLWGLGCRHIVIVVSADATAAA